MSNLSTLPKGDSAWLLRKAIERIIQQVSVLETNIGSSTTGNSADTQIIFNDNGTLRGDAGLVYNKTTDTLTAGNATITGDLTVDTSTLKVDSTNNRVGIGTATPSETLEVKGTANFYNTSGTYVGFKYNVTQVGYIGTANAFITSGATTNFGIQAQASLVLATGAGAVERYNIDSTGISTWSVAGTTAMTLNSTGLGIGASPTAPFHVFSAATGTGPITNVVGTFRVGAAGRDVSLQFSDTVNQAYVTMLSGALLFGTGGATERMRIDATGNVSIGVAATGTRRLELKSAGTSNTTFAAHFRDSADTLLFHVRSDGYFNTGQGTLSPYSNTTASAANMFVDSSGFVYRSTSSLKYKTDVKDSIHGLADVLKLRSVTYKSKNGDDTVFGGLIAEEVHAAGLTEFVAYAPDKTPDSINYGNMVALLVSAIQELTARVQTLEAR